jgi:hypothetical protein
MHPHTDLNAATAAEHRQRLLAEAAEHRRAALARRRRRQLRLRSAWLAVACSHRGDPVPDGPPLRW